MGNRFLDLIIKVVISVQTRLADARFVHRQDLPSGPLNWLLKFPAIAYERFHERVSAQRDDLVLQRFSRLHEKHYGSGGRGYAGIAVWNPEKRLERYQRQVARLEDFVNLHADLLNYRNGDRFADLACGTGQNIRFLANSYPASPIVGCDLNEDALNLIKEFEDSSRILLEQGDLRDEKFLDALFAEPVDHIIVCHAFSLLLGESMHETVTLRQRIISQLVKHSRKSVTIIDNFGERQKPRIRVEQAHRMMLSDDVMSYFELHPEGRPVLVHSARTQAVIFRHSF